MSTNMTETTSAPPKRGALSQEFFKTVFTDRFLFRDIPFRSIAYDPRDRDFLTPGDSFEHFV